MYLESSKSSKGTTSWQLKQLTTSMESHSSQSFELFREPDIFKNNGYRLSCC
ncbi:hypothetical protein Lalb_Chr08g0234081 [Lupinus albus]|uniref:Uncharacterized protein n=1 Tax=Lupinus albus TaxID=3870 RepID=A0A6A4Q442_LUPAL|nr:hypothetical protein Lalb_Chr08g0234081 [Lupinus albus]